MSSGRLMAVRQGIGEGIGKETISSARDAEESNVRIRFEVEVCDGRLCWKVVLKSYKSYKSYTS